VGHASRPPLKMLCWTILLQSPNPVLILFQSDCWIFSGKMQKEKKNRLCTAVLSFRLNLFSLCLLVYGLHRSSKYTTMLVGRNIDILGWVFLYSSGLFKSQCHCDDCIQVLEKKKTANWLGAWNATNPATQAECIVSRIRVEDLPDVFLQSGVQDIRVSF
jgi:hypothetical protein